MSDQTPVAKPTAATDQKVLAAVATIPVVGLVMFYAMKDASPLVKNYAKQSNFLLLLWIISGILGMTVFGIFFGFLVGLLELAAWILLVINAWQERMYQLPIVGEYFDKLLK
jgi:uncharacterized membrane protein